MSTVLQCLRWLVPRATSSSINRLHPPSPSTGLQQPLHSTRPHQQLDRPLRLILKDKRCHQFSITSQTFRNSNSSTRHSHSSTEPRHDRYIWHFHIEVRENIVPTNVFTWKNSRFKIWICHLYFIVLIKFHFCLLFYLMLIPITQSISLSSNNSLG